MSKENVAYLELLGVAGSEHVRATLAEAKLRMAVRALKIICDDAMDPRGPAYGAIEIAKETLRDLAEIDSASKSAKEKE